MTELRKNSMKELRKIKNKTSDEKLKNKITQSLIDLSLIAIWEEIE
jgi:hypothetical protein